MSNRCLTLEESERRLKYFRSQYDRSTEQEGRDVWRNQIDQIENWQRSEKFKTGCFPRGIDELMLELIEWRALMYALQNAETEGNPFKDHVFFMQWLVGGTYALSAGASADQCRTAGLCASRPGAIATRGCHPECNGSSLGDLR